ncbi:hypothetical protein ACFOG5_12735 [Pedobacter fastidiosus]|uniref:Outer membrane insertion C-terminal signal n=1 Tax=Pedobacter fastidiosus TaxID=2765361 RepID=A0ABR7KLZ2_9SPHI|nr:hypothetical protein [Pedobacter fastidiosus]MBC6109098.1 hypothetical protein [Pedobacter fastidiosus]
MKKLIFTIFGCVALFAMTTTSVKAQNYKTGLGLGIDFGDGATLVGPSIRHHFSRNAALQGEVLFGGNSTILQAFLQYNAPISGAKGLDWYLGGGPSVQLYDGGSSFYLVPMVGLDYKFSGAPLALALDWRPRLYIGSNDSDFNAGRFGLGFRYTF